MYCIRKCFLLSLIAVNATAVPVEHPLQHYIYFDHRDAGGANIRANQALHDARFSGAQIVYAWRHLEPRRNQYDFRKIQEDLLYLNSIGKQLWIQLQDKSFTPNYNVPDYILHDPLYRGGVLKQSMLTAPERVPNQPLAANEYGWSAKMWEQPVRERFQQLLQQLGGTFDGNIAGINFSESSIEIGTENADGSVTFPADFTPQAYVAAILENMQVLAATFNKSIPMVYLNFVPGEWLPGDDKNYMRSLFAQAEKLKMGIGGPDLMPYRKIHMTQSYGFFKTFPSTLVKGMAVQEGNLRQINPKRGRTNTVTDILHFAQHYLRLNYIFWVEEEPYFSDEVLRQLPGRN